jgi:hypothetical protein
LSATTFSPAVGAPTVIHRDTTILNSFPSIDSIWAFYGPQHDLTGITSGAGKVTVKYTIQSDSADQYLGDDTTSYSFYTTDSLYSKGRYDFANHRPMVSLWEAPTLVTTTTPPTGDFFLWGPMYYIAQGGGYFDTVQWSMASNSDTGHIISSLSTISVYVFKWVDGTGGTLDSFVENGELQLVGTAPRNFSGSTNPADTSGGYFAAKVIDSNGVPAAIHVDSNSWYFIAPELPNGWFVGLDGNNSSLPRTYGRGFFNNYIEYPSTMWAGARSAGSNPMVADPTAALLPWAFGGSVNLDSVHFASQKGLIPAVPFTTTRFVPDTSHSHVGVHNTKQAFEKFEVYPNPASDVVNASMAFENAAGTVIYTILDGSARVVAKETHNNVMMNDKFTYNTGALAAGNYFIVAYSNGKQMFRKFTVIR